MIRQKLLPALIGLSLAAGLWSMNASAVISSVSDAQPCRLGTTCPIAQPGQGVTYYITPATGTDYTCYIMPKSHQMTVIIWYGKDFTIQSGQGLHTMDKTTQVRITGTFAHPEDRNDIGQIQIQKVTGDDGDVACAPTL